MFDHFGTAVAVHENTALIGAHGKDEGAEDSGAAYIFVRNGVSWIQQAKLAHRNPVPGDQFGHAVAIYGDNALIGAHRSDTQQVPILVPHIFLHAMVGHGTKTLNSSQMIADFGDEFGYAVDLTNGIAIIGAP